MCGVFTDEVFVDLKGVQFVPQHTVLPLYFHMPKLDFHAHFCFLFFVFLWGIYSQIYFDFFFFLYKNLFQALAKTF